MNILKDYQAFVNHTGSYLKPFFKIHLACMFLFRISHFLYKIKLVPISRLFWMINRIVFSIDIDPRAQLRGGVVILHGIGLVIGRYVVIEGNVKLYQGVTLGGNNDKKALLDGVYYSQPIIKKDCVIGINATVIGPVILEEGARIGAHAVVTKDVPKGAVVVSNNKIVSKDNL